MKIIGEELEIVTHFKCSGTSTEEECCMETEITVRIGPMLEQIERNAGEYCAQKDAYETDQTGNATYGADTLATTKRQEIRI